MTKILIVYFLAITPMLISDQSVESNFQTDKNYQDNLKVASDYFLAKKVIPLDVLISLVPKDDSEFEFYYGTTYPNHKLSGTGFFYETARLIFEQVTTYTNEDFYLPSLMLLSFADGEYAEEFIAYLELIIESDKEKFCRSINGKEYVNHNPIKYYSEVNNCN